MRISRCARNDRNVFACRDGSQPSAFLRRGRRPSQRSKSITAVFQKKYVGIVKNRAPFFLFSLQLSKISAIMKLPQNSIFVFAQVRFSLFENMQALFLRSCAATHWNCAAAMGAPRFLIAHGPPRPCAFYFWAIQTRT